MTSRKYGKARGFTLIELLVVIAIIGLLASIMMPSLSKARELAKSASCISNLHNLGIMLTVYTTDNSRLYPTAYSYLDGNAGSSGYNHWSAAIEPNEYPLKNLKTGKYPRKNNLFVCPSHKPGGWAPSHFTSVRIPTPPAGQVSQNDTGGAANDLDDQQTANLSYIANEVLMPRKKFSAAHDTAAGAGAANTANLCQVNADEIDGAGNTILLAEFSDNANCIYGSSTAGGATYKSHRPTSGVKSSQANGVFDGEAYSQLVQAGTAVTFNKMSLTEAQTAIDVVKADKTAAATNHHISYINPESHGSNGSNYTFADGHAAKATLKETFDPGNYMWGRKVYSVVEKPEIQD